MTKYDDASWHCGEDFPKGLPEKNSATHTGMFLNWCMNNNLHSQELKEACENEIESLKRREITGADFVINALDGKFSEHDLNDFGNAFSKDYYVDETDFADKFSSFATDYINIFDSLAEERDFEYETFYHIEDTYANYDLMKQIIDHRFLEWKKYRNLN
ncbi:hypothetical protein CHRY9390_00567 [Chryseobacterium aquaeductus]|uniref:DUF7832 domain-containing protein n=1 Tax=Chryseobacterium aquaeductus TaxID=2675056 RepID=A0A9N8MLK2_9FLAO|nr:hypothetical protein [Chryseobacterium aquaeductus]CAA7329918.1 hypothetical protein CHRY9390_00567 [Chryseobacterium potabilaquae]CAD7799997.1 hypothetical protein CHRY9390_00567 [Chryseobacterium aquaeductus]